MSKSENKSISANKVQRIKFNCNAIKLTYNHNGATTITPTCQSLDLLQTIHIIIIIQLSSVEIILLWNALLSISF